MPLLYGLSYTKYLVVKQSELDTLAATLKQLENQKGEAQKRLNDLKGQVMYRVHTAWHCSISVSFCFACIAWLYITV
jgi:hypothetical protein